MDPRATVASLADEERLVYASLQRWVEEIAGCDFAKYADTPVLPMPGRSATTTPALHIDRLARGLARVVSEIRSL